MFCKFQGPFHCKLLQLFSSGWVVWRQQKKSCILYSALRPRNAAGPDGLLAFPLLPTISATTFPLDCDKEITLHQQETQGLLVELYLNLETCVFPLKTNRLGNEQKVALNKFPVIPAEGDRAALTLPQKLQFNLKAYNTKASFLLSSQIVSS